MPQLGIRFLTMETRRTDVQVTFSNYNYSFSYFYTKYKELCIEISNTQSLSVIRKKVTAFAYDFSYAITTNQKRVEYWNRFKAIREAIDSDTDYIKIINKTSIDFKLEVKYYNKFYFYLINYLEVLSEFVSELTATLMPHTNLQRKLVRFFNTQEFFEKLSNYKSKVLTKLGEFKISNFIEGFNSILIFYKAYYLFINENEKYVIEEILSICLSKFLSGEVMRVLNKASPSRGDGEYIKKLETEIYENLLYCNSLINISFSNYGILPKPGEKVYVDKTLI